MFFEIAQKTLIKDDVQRIPHMQAPSSLRGPTHQKWSNFAIFGFIVQFDPWVGAHLWKKIRVLGALETPQMGGALETPQMGGERSHPPPIGQNLKVCQFC